MYTFEYDDQGNIIANEEVVIESTNVNKPVSTDVTAPLVVEREPNFWETDIKINTTTIHTHEPVDVYMSEKVQEKIAILMQKFVRMEWLAYLVGRVFEDGSYHITDLAIPEQEVTPVNVYVQGDVDVPIVGVIHSHHDMGNNFSHTDDEYINSNHDLSLCVCNNGINGQARIKKEDGHYEIAPVKVHEYCSFDKEAFLEEVDELISERIYSYRARVISGATKAITANYYSDVNNEKVEKRNVIDAINEYKFMLKADEVSDKLDLAEVSFMYVLINNLTTDDWDKVQGYVYDGIVTISFEAMDLMDELDLCRDDLTQNEHVKINELYTYLADILECNNYNPDCSDEETVTDESNQ
jgi:hypothetical protein